MHSFSGILTWNCSVQPDYHYIQLQYVKQKSASKNYVYGCLGMTIFKNAVQNEICMNYYFVRFQVLMTASIKMTVFWNIALGSLTEIGRRPDNERSKNL
jgi:hypothetical protein